MGHFSEPPAEGRVFETAWRNLLPEYRRAMVDKLVTNLDEIERYGRMWERQGELNRRYVPPPPASDFHLVGAGFSGAGTKIKIAAVKEAGEERRHGKAGNKRVTGKVSRVLGALDVHFEVDSIVRKIQFKAVRELEQDIILGLRREKDCEK